MKRDKTLTMKLTSKRMRMILKKSNQMLKSLSSNFFELLVICILMKLFMVKSIQKIFKLIQRVTLKSLI
jgi:hypothetical protein